MFCRVWVQFCWCGGNRWGDGCRSGTMSGRFWCVCIGWQLLSGCCIDNLSSCIKSPWIIPSLAQHVLCCIHIPLVATTVFVVCCYAIHSPGIIVTIGVVGAIADRRTSEGIGVYQGNRQVDGRASTQALLVNLPPICSVYQRVGSDRYRGLRACCLPRFFNCLTNLSSSSSLYFFSQFISSATFSLGCRNCIGQDSVAFVGKGFVRATL